MNQDQLNFLLQLLASSNIGRSGSEPGTGGAGAGVNTDQARELDFSPSSIQPTDQLNVPHQGVDVPPAVFGQPAGTIPATFGEFQYGSPFFPSPVTFQNPDQEPVGQPAQGYDPPGATNASGASTYDFTGGPSVPVYNYTGGDPSTTPLDLNVPDSGSPGITPNATLPPNPFDQPITVDPSVFQNRYDLVYGPQNPSTPDDISAPPDASGMIDPQTGLPAPPGQPIDAPGGDLASITDLPPGWTTADVPISPQDNVFGVSTRTTEGTGPMYDANGNIIPGTGTTAADQAAINNLDNRGIPQGTPGGGVGQFFRDAAGNILDAAGNIVQAAGHVAGNIADSVGNFFGDVGPAGYQSPPGTTFGDTGALNEGILASLPPGTTLPSGLSAGLGSPLTPPGGIPTGALGGGSTLNLGGSSVMNAMDLNYLRRLMKGIYTSPETYAAMLEGTPSPTRNAPAAPNFSQFQQSQMQLGDILRANPAFIQSMSSRPAPGEGPHLGTRGGSREAILPK